jgi:tetratricopeptide (TPR) repeat protein
MRFVTAALLSLSTVVTTVSVLGQESTIGSVAGIVVDADGGMLAGASVTAVRQPTGGPYQTVVKYESVTKQDGSFVLTGVVTGDRYSVTVTKPGFTPFLQHVAVRPGVETRVNVTLRRDRVTAFVQANKLFEQHDYAAAARKYEEAIAADPGNGPAYFFLGNSYDQIYAPSRKGQADNDVLLAKAVENYRTAIRLVRDPKIKKLALEFLIAAYGPDKLNEPVQAVSVVQDLIALHPTDPRNHFVLAKIYEDTGNYEHAEHALIAAKQANPTDPAVYLQLAGYYNRQGEFEKTMETLGQRAALEPTNPEAHYIIATYYWDKAYRDFRLPGTDKRKYVEQGLEAADRALGLKDDYMDALVYKNLLLRLMANLETDPAKQSALLQEADALRDRAQAIRRKQ